jgi:hypothetical protein
MSKNKKSGGDTAGAEFEKLVSRIQQQFDPNAHVTHNELLTDRLGHKRQFDVVIHGMLAGHQLLGVIECKDLKRNVGVQDIEAFVTKSRDVNANLKIFVSKRGFTKRATEKASDHGVQTLSLFPQDTSEPPVIGTKWYADTYFWKRIVFQVHFVQEPPSPIQLDADEVTINGKRVIDWFKNRLLTAHNNETKEGWIVNTRVDFRAPQTVKTGTEEYRCTGISFSALRGCERKVKKIGWSGSAFYDWQTNQVKVPPQTTLKTYPIPTDFESWDDREEDEPDEGAFLSGHFIVVGRSFELAPDAIDLEAL